jgi:hypothetical protein
MIQAQKEQKNILKNSRLNDALMPTSFAANFNG